MQPYLTFVIDTMQTLLDRQTARVGGAADGALCLTITRATSLRWRSIGPFTGTTYENFLIEAQPIEPAPYRLDVGAWPLLRRLTMVTGDGRYAAMVDAMAAAFGEYGYHPRSGLPYLGAQAEFDVVNLCPAPMQSYDEPVFKPTELPLDDLWAAVPARMTRMAYGAYYGLVTRPETLDYNRYCTYEFDAESRQHVLAFASNHRAFASTGAALIYYWATTFARTGDRECLGWALMMAEKWRAAQHPESGLLPHFFGTDLAGEPTMPPYPLANPNDLHTCRMLLDAAEVLETEPALADLLTALATTALRGYARHGYLPAEGRFPSWLELDGREYLGHAFYAFRTQAEKDAAVQIDPILQEVDVFPGLGFFTGDPWSLGMYNRYPLLLARAAERTGDPELLVRVTEMAPAIMAAARALPGEFNARGQWSYPEVGAHLDALVTLHRLTGDARYLTWARELADAELLRLAAPLPADTPDWWRLSYRNGFLTALLNLAQVPQLTA